MSSAQEVFGNPDDNVQLISVLVAEMRSRDHDVLVVEQNDCEVYKMLEALILSEEVNKRKTSGGDKMRKADKISFMKNWKVNNIQMLIDGGLDTVIQGPNVPKFVSGVFSQHQVLGQRFLTYSMSTKLTQLT